MVLEIQALKNCIKNENKFLAKSIQLLADISHKKLHLAQGYSSLFEFCTEELCMSEGSIYRRCQVARQSLRHPTLVDYLAQSKLNLTVASKLCPHLKKLSQSDGRRFMSQFVGKTKREVEDLLADLSPPRPAPKDDETRLADRPTNSGQGGQGSDPSPSREACYRYRFAAGPEFKANLKRAKELLSNTYPEGKMEDILGKALEVLLAQLQTPRRARKKIHGTDSSTTKRYIPTAIRQAVVDRSGGQCEFVAASGRRCAARKFLEIDHRRPMSLGGRTELTNLSHLCRNHNQLKADLDHGRDFMDNKRD